MSKQSIPHPVTQPQPSLTWKGARTFLLWRLLILVGLFGAATVQSSESPKPLRADREAADNALRTPVAVPKNTFAPTAQIVEMRSDEVGSAPRRKEQDGANNLSGSGAASPQHQVNGVFIHPGGLHTKADLDRMKEKVVAGEHPWIDSWTRLIKDPKAQASYRDRASFNIGDTAPGKPSGPGRQATSGDAHAAYLNFIRWYVTGDRQYADCAIRICNNWSASVTESPLPGLTGIPIGEFAMVGELLRCCPFWKAEDQERFKGMMRTHLYPSAKAYLDDHNKTGNSNAWANWDISNIQALIAIGVLLDDRTIFNEGVEYFKNGRGTGSIKNAVYFIHPGGLGQWQESGRDQGHGHLGVGMMGQLCQIAWNQGVDLFGYDDNRLLSGAKYVAATTLLQNPPFKFYNNDSNAKNYWLSDNGYGQMSSPVWELIYNHYVVLRGLKAPGIAAMAGLTRPEEGGGDHFGYGTLTFTLRADASPYPAMKLPAAPKGLSASPGLGRVNLNWANPANHDASGYIVRRATSGGNFETIADRDKDIANRYTDEKVEPGVTYRYVVAARNPAGIGPESESVTATAEASGSLPPGWKISFIGSEPDYPTDKMEGGCSKVGNRSIRIVGVGRDISGSSDSATFVGCEVQADCRVVGRLVVSPQVGFPSTNAPKMGMMIRESLDPGARCAALSLGEAGLRGTRARFRREPNTNPSTSSGNDYSWMPIWYKIERKGNTFTAWHCKDGTNWIEVGSSTIPMSEKCLMGFFVTGSDKPKSGTIEAVFDNIQVSGKMIADPKAIRSSKPGR